ncbi:glycoside hydrolase family 6 protein [Micromonospora sp. WMMD980]|uniref:glycoside hydrolase family 6 protein n=1 Tax=Micromonospora sp. WMMD980 TaxID=3016088 RepID=UPI00241653A2|nr:glycoside hydrolase family 6 protein [Micromonospora sp. WMMD980]MDG4803268.1 glycoside hydrolase family 6 protein [Micromonospora sp. WMMD980]
MAILSFRRRRSAALGAAAVAGLTAAGICLTVGGASAGTVSGSLYRDPSSAVVRWVAANPGDSRAAAIRDKIASQPQARWYANFNPSTIQSEVSSFVGAANAAQQIPVLSVYEITNRDCGGASAGGAPDLNQYQTWVSNFARGLGNQTVLIILETDSLALQTCLGGAELNARNQAISTATRTIKAGNPNAKVYLDGGHSTWNSANETANRLRNAGVQYADGFFTNVSNFNPTSSEANFGRAVISALNGMGISGKRQVIDTSRNGGASGDWCADDNTDRRIGTYPTTNTGDANIDAYLWVKPPGEADGCRYTAGSFQPDLAFSLANGAPNPPTTAPPTTTPPTTAPPTTAPPTTTPPTTTPPTTTPPTTTPPPTGNGCSASVSLNQWSGGFTASVTVTAGSAALNGWSVTLTLPGGAAVTGVWSAQASGTSGTVRFSNVSYNGSVGAGQSTNFGFQGTGTGPGATASCTAG